MSPPAVRKVRRAGGAELVERSGGRLEVRKTVYLSPKVDGRLAAYARGRGLAQSDVVESALLAFLPEPKPERGKP